MFAIEPAPKAALVNLESRLKSADAVHPLRAGHKVTFASASGDA
jgi:hypothetical protein